MLPQRRVILIAQLVAARDKQKRARLLLYTCGQSKVCSLAHDNAQKQISEGLGSRMGD